MIRAFIAAALLSAEIARAGVCPALTFRAHAIAGYVCLESGTKCVPIPGARVQLLDNAGTIVKELSVDRDGSFRIETSSGGELTLSVSAEGFHPAECRIISKKASKPDQRLRVALGSDALLPCGGSRIIADAR